MKAYEKLTIVPIEVASEGNILVSSGEITTRRIDPINVTVDELSKETIGSKTFDMILD